MDRKKLINNVLLTYFREHHVKMGMKYHIDYYMVKDICALLKLVPNTAMIKLEKRYKDAGLSLDGIIETIPQSHLPEGSDMEYYVNAQGAFEMFFMSEVQEAVKFRAWVISSLLINSEIEFDGDLESSLLAPSTGVEGARARAAMETYKSQNKMIGIDGFGLQGKKPLLADHDYMNSRKGIIDWIGKHEQLMEADAEYRATYECASKIHDNPLDPKYSVINKKYLIDGKYHVEENGVDKSYVHPGSDY